MARRRDRVAGQQQSTVHHDQSLQASGGPGRKRSAQQSSRSPGSSSGRRGGQRRSGHPRGFDPGVRISERRAPRLRDGAALCRGRELRRLRVGHRIRRGSQFRTALESRRRRRPGHVLLRSGCAHGVPGRRDVGRQDPRSVAREADRGVWIRPESPQSQPARSRGRLDAVRGRMERRAVHHQSVDGRGGIGRTVLRLRVLPRADRARHAHAALGQYPAVQD